MQKFPQGGVPRKKVLALVLTLALALSVAAGAAFTDQKQIKNTEAVDMCVALNIISGYPDGSFKPEGNITRAEFTKMICVMLNGGKEPTLGTAVNSSFTDVRGTSNAWADKYIESCVSQGIVSGIGGGKFNPAGNVTGSEAAKMLLVALGYKSDIESFTGSAWEVNVNVKATEKGLYDDLAGLDTSKALSRDNAAQMVWNALKAKEVVYDYTLVSENGQLVSKTTLNDKNLTLLADKYDAKDDQFATMTGYSWSEKDKEYTYSFTCTDNDQNLLTSYKYTSAQDYTDLFGMPTKVIYKVKNSDVTVYGMFAKDAAILATAAIDDMDTSDVNKVEIDGTKYSVDKTVGVTKTDYSMITAYAENDWTNDTTLADSDISPAFQAKFIDADNDGDIDYLVYMPFTYGTVKSVGSKSVFIDNGVGSLKTEDNIIYSGIAKDDYVVVYSAANTAYEKDYDYVVEKMASFEGAVTGQKTNSSNQMQYQVNGAWYTEASEELVGSLTLDSKYTFYVVGNFVYYADLVEGTSLTDVLFVSDAEDGGISGFAKAKVYFTSGTTSTITVDEIHDYGDNDVTDDYTADELIGSLFTYTEKNGEYTLTPVDTNNKAGISKYAEAADASISAADTNKPGKLVTDDDSYAFANDAVVFILYKDGAKTKVVTGAVAKDYSSAVDASSAQILYKDVNGVSTIQCVGIVSDATKLPSSKGETDNYGYVVSAPYSAKVSGDKYTAIPVWDGTKVETYYYDGALAVAEKGDVIKYSDLGNKEIGDIEIMNATDVGVIGAITGVDGKNVVIDGEDFYITSDTVILYVDTANYEGSETGAVVVANETGESGTTNYVDNALYVADTGTKANELKLLVIDTDNEWVNTVLK